MELDCVTQVEDSFILNAFTRLPGYREKSFEPYESDSEEDRTDTPVQDLDFNFRNAGYHSGPGSNATWLKVVT